MCRGGVFFLPPSDAYVRTFVYLLYTLIKLYYTKKKKKCFVEWVMEITSGFNNCSHTV